MDDKAAIVIAIQKFFQKLRNIFLDKHIFLYNEMYTSKIASHYLKHDWIKKRIRNEKTTLDMLSAAIILESYLSTRNKKHTIAYSLIVE